LALFDGARDWHIAIGEGSTWYLRSGVAIRQILQFQPRAKFILMLRNPVEMVQSVHEQALYNYLEEETSFTKAWGLQASRSVGKQIPKTCKNPKSLQYGWRCRLGEQVEALYRVADRADVKVVLYDDFCSDTRKAYEEVLDFLGLERLNEIDLRRVNEGKRHRLKAIKNLDWFLRRPPPLIDGAKRGLKQLLGVESFGIHRFVHRLNQTVNLDRSPRKPLSPEMRAELIAYFKDDVCKLSDLLGRDLSHWLQPSESATRKAG
jgi:hypothetical protein